MSRGMALALGSLWAIAPARPAALVLVLRTSMEDRLLKAELAGYEAYSQKGAIEADPSHLVRPWGSTEQRPPPDHVSRSPAVIPLRSNRQSADRRLDIGRSGAQRLFEITDDRLDQALRDSVSLPQCSHLHG